MAIYNNLAVVKNPLKWLFTVNWQQPNIKMAIYSQLVVAKKKYSLKWLSKLKFKNHFKIKLLLLFYFITGKCRGDEIRCSNGYCIKHSIFCNGHRPCGNVTDSCGDRTIPQPYSATNIVLAVLIPLALLTIVGASLYVYCCRNRRCRGSDSSNSWVRLFCHM